LEYFTKRSIISHKNKKLKVTTTQEALNNPAIARTKAYQNSCLKKPYELKEMDMLTNSRKAVTTTPEYITVKV
jgi:hypothetical protein